MRVVTAVVMVTMMGCMDDDGDGDSEMQGQLSSDVVASSEGAELEGKRRRLG